MTSLAAEQRGLVTEHARVVQTVVRRHAARYEGLVSAEELTQAAQLALVAAARAFDPSRGVPFGGFAWKRVEGAVLRIAGREAEARHQRRASGGRPTGNVALFDQYPAGVAARLSGDQIQKR